MIQIPAYVSFVLDTLEANGYAAYIVGGSVRDALRGQAPDDFDVTTAAAPDAVRKLFEPLCRVILTGLKHGTVTVLVDTHPIEVTTFRTDGDYQDNRHPDSVTFVTSPEADLARRDFTINAMAYSPTRGLIDLYGGQTDLQNRRLRCVGTPQIRFEEDALRMLRALRFASVLQFEIDHETAHAIHEGRMRLKNVSAERIRTELFKLLCGGDAQKILQGFSDVFFTVFPALEHFYTKTLYAEAVCTMCTLEREPVLRFAALLVPIAAKAGDACAQAVTQLKTDNKSASKILFALQHADEVFARDRIGIRHALHRYGEVHLRFCLQLQKDESALQMLDTVCRDGDIYRIADLAVNGEDIAALGYTGKRIGDVLSRLLSAVMDGTLANEKEALLTKAKQY